MSTYQWIAPAGTDPDDDGGSVGQLRLDALYGETFVAAATVLTATRVEAGRYEWVLPATLVESTYWPHVTVDPDGTGAVTQPQPAVALPGWETTGRVVSPFAVATELGLPQPLLPDVAHRITTAIDRAQGKVEDYLNRPLLPTLQTFTGHAPLYGVPTTEAEAWPTIKRAAGDTISVASVALSGFVFTVDVWVGLNAATDTRAEGIRSFIVADASATLRATPGDARLGPREVQSVSADGQSVSYQQAAQATSDGAAGAAPTLNDLRRWRRRSVYQRPTAATPPWPYSRTP